MRLLLDTHTYLWLRGAPDRLGTSAADAIASAENQLYLSIVSLWEMTIKSAKKQLMLPAEGIAAAAAELPYFGIALLELSLDDIVALEGLPPVHRDPFDRLLVAQAQRHGLTLVTVDNALAAYDVPTLWS